MKIRTFFVCSIAVLIVFSARMVPVYAAGNYKEGSGDFVYRLWHKALPFENLEIAGSLKNATALRVSGGYEEFMKEANILDLKAKYNFNDSVSLFTIFHWFYDSAYDIENKFSDVSYEDVNRKLRYPEKMQWLRECYLDILNDKVDFRLGKQQVVWGTADGLRILDMINPLDYREWTLPNYVDSRIPLWMLKTDARVTSNSDVQLLVIPDYEPNYYAPDGAPFTLRTVHIGAEGVQALVDQGVTVSTIDQEPTRNLRNSKIGLRWHSVVEGGPASGLDYTLNYLHTWDFASSAYTLFTFTPPYTYNFKLTRRAEQIEVLGGTFSKSITKGVIVPGLMKGWTLRGELAWIHNGAMNYGTDKNIVGTVDVDQLNYVLGFDKEFLSNWFFSTQLIQYYAHAQQDVDKNKYTLLFGPTRGPLDRVETYISARVNTDYMHEKLKPEVLVLYGDDNDWRISPKVSYEFNDQWQTAVGFHFFEGRPQHLNGQFDKNDEVFVETTYSW